jgi:hypothetical protein
MNDSKLSGAATGGRLAAECALTPFGKLAARLSFLNEGRGFKRRRRFRISLKYRLRGSSFQ